ncbi:uncharacterized protein [Chironomus tepperi]|uniref:uncharacterized protein isoform X3 n=1 Tax=Chironomus tepperi TaxID=113505 RepID=UPI00391F14B4
MAETDEDLFLERGYEEPRTKIQKLDNDEGYLFKLFAIINIISYLDDINDIKNCFLLSKDIRILMLQSPTIMRKFIFVFESISDSLKVVKSRLMAQHLGLYIRNVKVQLEKKSSDYMEELSKFLSQLPNLESLVFEVNKSYEFKFTSTFPQFESSNDLPNSSNQVGCMFDLPNLKVLDIRYQDLKLLLNNTYI